VTAPPRRYNLSKSGKDRLHPLSASVTELITRLRTGDESALGELTPALYGELRRIASRQISGERPNHTLQATALVHEAYLKLINARDRTFADQVHFLAVASRVMRQVLVDHARARSTQKRLGDARRENLWTTTLEIPGEDGTELIELIELDAALEALAAENATLARLIEMRYFGGMTAEESAAALGISVHVVRHDLRFAQAWLRRKLSS
jgi:RNA polymerase sigma-70 factor, ECF subfamily